MTQSTTRSARASGRLHRTSEGGVRPGRSRPLSVLTPAVLLPSIVTFLGVFAVAQAQEADGAISGLTLTSEPPGTIAVSWSPSGCP